MIPRWALVLAAGLMVFTSTHNQYLQVASAILSIWAGAGVIHAATSLAKRKAAK